MTLNRFFNWVNLHKLAKQLIYLLACCPREKASRASFNGLMMILNSVCVDGNTFISSYPQAISKHWAKLFLSNDPSGAHQNFQSCFFFNTVQALQNYRFALVEIMPSPKMSCTQHFAYY